MPLLKDVAKFSLTEITLDKYDDGHIIVLFCVVVMSGYCLCLHCRLLVMKLL